MIRLLCALAFVAVALPAGTDPDALTLARFAPPRVDGFCPRRSAAHRQAIAAVAEWPLRASTGHCDDGPAKSSSLAISWIGCVVNTSCRFA
jgi:hypothetical protein